MLARLPNKFLYVYIYLYIKYSIPWLQFSVWLENDSYRKMKKEQKKNIDFMWRKTSEFI